jgi:hypothetical protein
MYLDAWRHERQPNLSVPFGLMEILKGSSPLSNNLYNKIGQGKLAKDW